MTPWDKLYSDAAAFGRGVRSNTVPMLLGGPVDLISTGLGAAGVNTGRAPVGGSAWITQQLRRAGMIPDDMTGDPMESFGGMVGGAVAPSAMNTAGRAAFAAEQNAVAPTPARSGPLGTQLGAVGPKRRAIGNLFDNVDDPAQAQAMARRSEHIKRDANGALVGAPASVNTPSDLARMRRGVDRKAVAGDWNADWYDRARAVTQELTPEPAQQNLFSRGTAAYSPQATPKEEVNYFTRQYNDRMLGGPGVTPRTKSAANNVDAGILSGNGDKIRLGKKTGPYGDAKNPTIDDASLYKTANDIWHGRVFGYTDADSSQFSRGFTPQEHGFLTGENLLMSDRLTKAGAPVGSMPAGTPWTPRRGQAATWGAERYAQEYDKLAEKLGKGTKTKPGRAPSVGEMDQLRADAAYGIDNAVERNTGYVTGEYVPGASLGHLAGVKDMPAATRQQFSDARFGAMSDADGRSLLLRDAGFLTRPAVRAEGKYTNSQGGIETNPMYADRPLLGMQPAAKEAGGGPTVQTQDRKVLDALTNLQGLTTVQEGLPWHKMTPANSSMRVGGQTGARLRGPQSELDALGDRLGGDYGLVNTGDGTTLMNFAGATGTDVQKALKGAMKKGRDVGPTGVVATPGRVDGGYATAFQDDAGNFFAPGSGGATQKALDLMAGVPRVEQNIDAAGRWRAGLGKLNEMDSSFAQQTGQPIRSDIQKLREILSTTGLAGLREWVAKNGAKGLPAVLLPLLGTGSPEDR